MSTVWELARDQTHAILSVATDTVTCTGPGAIDTSAEPGPWCSIMSARVFLFLYVRPVKCSREVHHRESATTNHKCTLRVGYVI